MGGLFVATFLTLLFLPSLYALWYRKRLDEHGDAEIAPAGPEHRRNRPLPACDAAIRRYRGRKEGQMMNVAEHIETDVRERILVTAERLFAKSAIRRRRWPISPRL